MPSLRARRARAALTMALVAGTTLLVGCASGTSANPPPRQTTGAATAVDPGTAAAQTADPAPAGTATPTVSATPSAASVNWDSGGRGTPAMAAGLPSPTGWYAAAFGAPTQQKVLYLTFDDGPAADTDPLLTQLRAAGAKATFFVLGQQAAANPSQLRRLVADGHAIGNHTWDHPELTSLTPDEVADQLSRTTAAVAAVVPGTEVTCMRPPYGLIDDSVAEVSLDQQLQPILWTGHAEDWNQPSVATMVADLRRATQPGSVILLHDGGGSRQNTLDAVAEMLPEWRAQGYTLAPIPACLRSPS